MSLLQPERIVKWFWADSTGVHNFAGPIQDKKDEERVRRTYAPGRKGITRLTIRTFQVAGEDEVIEA